MVRAHEPVFPPTFWQVLGVNVHKVKLKTQIEEGRKGWMICWYLQRLCCVMGHRLPGEGRGCYSHLLCTGDRCPIVLILPSSFAIRQQPWLSSGDPESYWEGESNYVQSPSPITSSEANYLLRPCLPLCPFSRRSHSLPRHLTPCLPLQLLKAIPGNLPAMPAREAGSPGKQVQELHILTPPFLLQIQSPLSPLVL